MSAVPVPDNTRVAFRGMRVGRLVRMGISGGMAVRRADPPLGGSLHGQGEGNGEECGEQAEFVHGFPRSGSSC